MIEQELAALQEQADRQLEAWEKGIIDDETFQRGQERLKKQREDLRVQLASFDATAGQERSESARQIEIQSLPDLLLDETISREERKRRLHDLVERVTWRRDGEILDVTLRL